MLVPTNLFATSGEVSYANNNVYDYWDLKSGPLVVWFLSSGDPATAVITRWCAPPPDTKRHTDVTLECHDMDKKKEGK